MPDDLDGKNRVTLEKIARELGVPEENYAGKATGGLRSAVRAHRRAMKPPEEEEPEEESSG